MKKAIKLIVTILTIMMVVGLTTPVFAEEPVTPWETAPEAKVTIENTTTNHTYEAYQLFKGKYSTSTLNDQTVHVLSNIEWGDAVAEILEKEIIISDVKDTVENYLLHYTLANGNPLQTDIKIEDDKYKVPTNAEELANAIRQLSSEADIQGYTNHVFTILKLADAVKGDAHIYHVDSTGTPAVINLTDKVNFAPVGDTNRENYELLHVKGKGEGYYLIKDKDGSLDDKVDDAYTRFIVRVAGAVSLSAKMSHPTVIKKVKENSSIEVGKQDGKISNYTLAPGFNDTADISSGELAEFEIVATVPSTIDGYKKLEYIFTDRLSKGLKLDGSPVIKLVDNAGKEYILTSGYQFTQEDHMTGEEGEKVLVDYHLEVKINDLKEAFKYKDSADAAEKNLAAGSVKSGWFVKIEYKAKLTEDAVIGGVGNSNVVELQYTNDPNGLNNGYGKTVSDEVRVYTYQLDVLKQNAQTENGEHAKLQNAKFKLSKTTGDSTTWAIIDAKGFVTRWDSLESNATVLTTDENGKILVKGLDQGKYALKETAAPTGFNQLAAPVTFEITSTIVHGQDITDFNTAVKPNISVKSSLDIAGEIASDSTANGVVSMYVYNKSGAQLPVTGGMGTTVIYVAGFAMVALATVTLVVRKKTLK